MIRLVFEVDRRACFVYWAQSLVRWGPYFEKRESAYYYKKAAPLSPEESVALENLRQLLQRENTGFLLLWNLYDGKEISNPEDGSAWNQIADVLEGKFTNVWNEEGPLLTVWRRQLRGESFAGYEKFLGQAQVFFGIQEPVHINAVVKLLLHYDTEAPTAHVKREYEKLLLLNISNVKLENRRRVIGTLLHEIVHRYDYAASDTTSPFLRSAYERIILPTKYKHQTQSWRYLFTESIIHSIASRRFSNVLGTLLATNQEEIFADRVGRFSLEKNKHNYDFLARVVAERLSLTKQYFEQGRTVDQKYYDQVAYLWLELFSKNIKEE